MQGNGVVAAPTAAAYQELTNASNQMLKDLAHILPQAKTVILYDPNLFSVIPYYASTTELVRGAAADLCNLPGGIASAHILSSVDIGEAAQGLASLVQLTIPNYAIQGQALTLDNSALVGSFAAAARASGYVVVNPTYLLPAVSQSKLTCETAKTSTSLADLWRFANSEAGAQQARLISRQAPSAAIQAFVALRQALNSSDKGPPLMARVLAAESLWKVIQHPEEVAVIDMRLDAADIDSTTRTVLWWHKSKFSANIAAHYSIFSVHGQDNQFSIQLVEPGAVNILRRNIDAGTFAISGDP